MTNPKSSLGDERIAEIRQRWEGFDWSCHGSALKGVRAVKDIHALLAALTTLHAEVEAREQAAHRSGVNEAPTLSEADKRFYARKRVSEASGEDARICPQDGSTCWGACEVSYCRGYADARDAAEQQRTEAQADLARVRQERDVERSRFAHYADRFGDLAYELQRRASSDWGHLRAMTLGSIQAAVKEFRKYAAGQPSPSNWRVRAEAAERAHAEAREQAAQQTNEATIQRLLADPVRQECDSLKEQRDTWHANYLAAEQLRQSAEAIAHRSEQRAETAEQQRTEAQADLARVRQERDHATKWLEHWKKLGDSVRAENEQVQAIIATLDLPQREDNGGHPAGHTAVVALRDMRDKLTEAQERITALEGALRAASDEVEEAIASIGSGECLKNTCVGCKMDDAMARDALARALALLTPSAGSTSPTQGEPK
jgi:hypothetical protein